MWSSGTTSSDGASPSWRGGPARVPRSPPPGLVVGYRPSADPDELIVTAGGNALDAPRGYRDLAGMVVNGARLNSQRVVDRKFKLPAPKASGGEGRRDARTGGGRSVR